MSQHSSVKRPTAYVAANARLSRAMGRVAAALTAYGPQCGVDITQNEEDADIVVLHVIGYPDTVAAIESIKARGKKFAMIQYCIKSTQEPDTRKWWPLWTDPACVGVWSYYDLPGMLYGESSDDDPFSVADIEAFANERFCFAPMGASSHFTKQAPSGRVRPYRLMTSGFVAESESVEECARATAYLNVRHFHLGPGFPFFGPNVTQDDGVNDQYLVALYNRSEYVAGLRRCEGFEMPALEGLLCGARPVLFDRPHYRHWFGSHAEYILEGTPAEVEAALIEALAREARPVTEEERAEVLAKFNWRTVITQVWRTFAPGAAATVADRRLRLLWVGDASISTGFAVATHAILATLHRHYDVAVLGINYTGDPHPYPYPIYPGINPLAREADYFGVKRVAEVALRHGADIVIIQQDPWNFPAYISELRSAEIQAPVVGFVAVDGKNCKGYQMNELAHAIFWTDFGAREAYLGGYTGTSSVIPLGVDRSIFFPMPKVAARRLLELGRSREDVFIVGTVNRNQPRKRLDLTVRYFCNWVKQYGRNDAHLFLHVAPTGDVGWDVEQLMRYYGLANRLILSQPDPGPGIPPQLMNATYNAFDVQISTTLGEGWGLPHLEGMACGIPQIVPDWAALGEWPKSAVRLIPCTSYSHAQNNLNVLGGVADEALFIEALESFYSNRGLRERFAQAAYDRACDEMFDWGTIGERFAAVLNAETPRMLGAAPELTASER